MKHSNFEEEMQEIFELLEECNLFDKKIFDLKEDELEWQQKFRQFF